MSVMTQSVPEQNGISSEIPGPSAQSSLTYRIKCAGKRPIVFQGVELLMVMNFSPDHPFWYELNLYQTNLGNFVVTVRLFHTAEDHADSVDAWEFDSLEGVFSFLETYDPTSDFQFSDVSEAYGTSSVGLLAKSYELRAKVKMIQDRFSNALGEFFYEIENI